MRPESRIDGFLASYYISVGGRIMNKRWIALMTAAAMLVSMTGCAKQEAAKPAADAAAANETIKLKIYVDYADDDTKVPYDYAVAELKKEMPNVELELEPMARDDGQKLKTYAQTGNLPDIFQVSVDTMNIFRASNNILVLDDYAADFKAKLQPGSESLLYHPEDNHIYSFPFAGKEYVVLYYNKTLFDKYGLKVPTTFEELKAVSKTFNDNGIVPLSIFAKEKWPCVSLYDVFATRTEPQGIMKMDSLQATGTEEGYKKAAQQIIDLVNAGLLPKGATNLNYDQAAALFYEGKAAMFLNGQWEIQGSTEKLGDQVDWMYYPSYDAAAYESGKANWSGGGSLGGLGVSPNTANKEVAAKVASFMALKYAEAKYTKRANPFVATVVDKTPEAPFPPMMDKLAKEIPNIKSTTGFAWHMTNPKVKAALEDNTQRLLTGTYSAEDFAKDMQKAIEEAGK